MGFFKFGFAGLTEPSRNFGCDYSSVARRIRWATPSRRLRSTWEGFPKKPHSFHTQEFHFVLWCVGKRDAPNEPSLVREGGAEGDG